MQKFFLGVVVGVVLVLCINDITKPKNTIENKTERQVLNEVVDTFGCTGYDKRGICKSAYGHLNYLNKNGLD